MITFKCVGCGATLRVVKEQVGKQGKCPRCSLMVRVPRSQMEADDAEYLLAQRQAHAQQKAASSGPVVGGEPFDELDNGSPPGRPVRKSRDMLDAHPGPETPRSAAAVAPGSGEKAPVGTEEVCVAARATSAPPMSWPAKTPPTPAPPQQAPGDGQSPSTTTPQGPAASAPRGAVQRPAAPALTASVRGSHGVLALLVLLVVAVCTVGWVVWRNWEHTWDFSVAISRCRPAMTFLARAGEPKAGSLTGKVLLCNELGGPSAVTSATDSDLVATSIDKVKAVIFVRSNDRTPQARALQRNGRILAAAPVGYDICAVDFDTRKVLWTATVGAEDEGRAVEALYGLIRRCMEPGGERALLPGAIGS